MKRIITTNAKGEIESIEIVRTVVVRQYLYTITRLSFVNGSLVLFKKDIYKNKTVEVREVVFDSRPLLGYTN